MLYIFDKEKNNHSTPDTGTYEWREGNRINEKLGESRPEVVVIESLSATKLVIKPEDKDKDLMVSFTRAK